MSEALEFKMGERVKTTGAQSAKFGIIELKLDPGNVPPGFKGGPRNQTSYLVLVDAIRRAAVGRPKKVEPKSLWLNGASLAKAG